MDLPTQRRSSPRKEIQSALGLYPPVICTVITAHDSTYPRQAKRQNGRVGGGVGRRQDFKSIPFPSQNQEHFLEHSITEQIHPRAPPVDQWTQVVNFFFIPWAPLFTGSSGDAQPKRRYRSAYIVFWSPSPPPRFKPTPPPF